MEDGGESAIPDRRPLPVIEEAIQPCQQLLRHPVKETDLFKKAYRDAGKELEGEEITRFRSVVGRLMYMARERPDAACTICHSIFSPQDGQTHSTSMAVGTAPMFIPVWNKTIDFGIFSESSQMPTTLAAEMTTSQSQASRCSWTGTSSTAGFRKQKAVALSSGESEFVAVVADGMLLPGMP